MAGAGKLIQGALTEHFRLTGHITTLIELRCARTTSITCPIFFSMTLFYYGQVLKFNDAFQCFLITFLQRIFFVFLRNILQTPRIRVFLFCFVFSSSSCIYFIIKWLAWTSSHKTLWCVRLVAGCFARDSLSWKCHIVQHLFEVMELFPTSGHDVLLQLLQLLLFWCFSPSRRFM